MIAYSFNGVTLPYVEKSPNPMASKVASGVTPGRPGSYSGTQRPNERKISIVGTLIVTSSFADLETAWAALCSAHMVGAAAQLCIRDDWFIWATSESFAPTEDGIDHYKYQADYKASDPYQYSATATAVDLGTTGATFPVTGNVPAAPAITINVSTSGGTITLTNTTTGDSFVLSPASTGAYIIDSRLETVTLAGVDVTAQFRGQFLLLPIGSNTVTIAAAGGAAISDAPLTYNPRSL